MTPKESFATDLRGLIGEPLRLEFFARYRQSIRENGTDVLVRLRHRTTGDGPCIVLTRGQVVQLALTLERPGPGGRWDTVQDSLVLEHKDAGSAHIRVGHRPSRVADYPTRWRTGVLEDDVRESAIEWLKKWLKEGWS